jgi:hypothetical protein
MIKISFLITIIMIPALIIQLWDGSYNTIGVVMFILFLAGIFSCVMIYGLIKNKDALILTLPLYMISFLLCYLCINTQLESNYTNASILIKNLESYKKREGHFPKSLPELYPNYISKMPKEWYGLTYSNFTYSTNQNMQTYQMAIKRSKIQYNIYESSIGVWQFLD